MITVQEYQVKSDDIIEKLKNVLFSHNLNKDTLARKISQETMMTLDFMINLLSANIYGVISCSLDGDVEHVKKIFDQINSIFNDILEFHKNIISQINEKTISKSH